MQTMTAGDEAAASASLEILEAELLLLREQLQKLAHESERDCTASRGNAKEVFPRSIQKSVSLVKECRSIVSELESTHGAPVREALLSYPSPPRFPPRSANHTAPLAHEFPQLPQKGFVDGRGGIDCRTSSVNFAVAKPPALTKPKDKVVHNIAVSLLQVAEAMRSAVRADEVVVLLPVEDGSKEFNVLKCSAERERTLSTRRLNQLEVSCWSTGIFISNGPDGVADVSESAIAAACVNEELLCDNTRKPFLTPSMPSDHGAHVLCCPVRCSTTDQPIGIACAKGRRRSDQAPFSTADEHHMLTFAVLVAHLAQHAGDVSSLVKAYSEVCSRAGGHALRMQVAAPPMRNKGFHRNEGVMPGADTQLISRNTSGECSRAKMISENGNVEDIHSRTPLVTVYQYIGRLEDSWKRSVLTSSSLKAAYEERQERCRHLLERLRLSELKCSVLEADRIASIDPSESHHELFFRRGDVYSCCKCGEPTGIVQVNGANGTRPSSRGEAKTSCSEGDSPTHKN